MDRDDDKCPYCTLKSIKGWARRRGLKITILNDASWGMQGYNVYAHPPDVDVQALPGGDEGPREEYHQIWFYIIQKSCTCYDK